MATIAAIREGKRQWFAQNMPYKMTYFKDFNYRALEQITSKKKGGRGNNASYNDVIIMADTETSKKLNSEADHIVAWTISIRAYSLNIVTLWGRKPSEFCTCVKNMLRFMEGSETYIYFHNLPYDYTFLELFLFKEFGFPKSQLNIRSHYPINITFENGLVLKDSLILAQRSLEKWAKDLKVEHQKAKGKWDYNKYRNQEEEFTEDELEYIEHDTLAGVECIDTLMKSLRKNIYSMPLTATGIPREEVHKRGLENRARDEFVRSHLNFEQYQKAVAVYHGGYTHGNRHHLNENIIGEIQCLDFTSSYPFCLLAFKYPVGGFTLIEEADINTIISMSNEYAFMFRLILDAPILKSDDIEMPYLQKSKSVYSVNNIVDNGRVVAAEWFELYTNEIDLLTILEQYDYNNIMVTEVEASPKEYLPRWFTDYIFELFYDKTTLKGSSDHVAYALAKAKLNSLYGLTCQRSIRDEITEVYQTTEDACKGSYIIESNITEDAYLKFLNKPKTLLQYSWGCWCTSYAARNLFTLQKCIDRENGGLWLYCDTDSIYSTKWNWEAVDEYNENCKRLLQQNGYDSVTYKGKEYTLGVATKDSLYTEFRYQGAKRYCGRSVEDGELHITVAGVPKKGAEVLQSIDEFKPGLVFPGVKTGKLLHKYTNVEDIYIDEQGNETGHSIRLEPCDYLLDGVTPVNWDEILEEEYRIGGYYE